MLVAPIGLALAAVLAQGQPAPQPAAQIRIKVILETRVHLLQRDASGHVIPRRGYLEKIDIEKIHNAAEAAKLQIHELSGGKTSLIIDFLQDEDPEVIWFDGKQTWRDGLNGAAVSDSQKEGSVLGLKFAQEVAEPWFNREKFDASSEKVYGPYQAAYLIHPALVNEGGIHQLNGTLTEVLPWYHFTQHDSQRALSTKFARRAAQLAGLPEPPSLETFDGMSYGQYKVDEVKDATNDDYYRITASGVMPRGAVRLAGDQKPSGYAVFKMRNKTTASWSLIGLDENDQVTGVVLLGESMAMPLEGNPAWRANRYNVLPGDNWKTVSVPVSELGNAAKVVFGLHPDSTLVEVNFGGQPIADATAIQFKEAPEAGSVAKLEPVAAPPLADLATRLASTKSEDRFSAMWELREVKSLESVPLLIPIVTGANALEANAAIVALANQDSPEGWEAIKAALFRGPFEANRRFAAQVMKGRLTEGEISAIIPTLALQGWRSRLAILKLLVDMPGRESSIVLATMLDDPYPQVRLYVVDHAPVAEPLIQRRLLYNAVNDSCETIRSHSLTRLIDVENESIRSEALKGIRDESVTVRLSLLTKMRETPQPWYRPALRQAVVDQSPKVRAAALDAFAAQAEPTDPNEIRNTFADNSHEVQLALARLAAAGKVTLPADTIRKLKASEHEDVREAAKSLNGS